MLIAIAQPSDIRKDGIEEPLLLLKEGCGISAEMHAVGEHDAEHATLPIDIEIGSRKARMSVAAAGHIRAAGVDLLAEHMETESARGIGNPFRVVGHGEVKGLLSEKSFRAAREHRAEANAIIQRGFVIKKERQP